MYELKRFTMKSTRGIRSVVKPDGMWCRYNDVERILKQLAKNNPRPMTNEEYLAALAKLQNEVNSFKGQAKADAKTIKKLRQECVPLEDMKKYKGEKSVLYGMKIFYPHKFTFKPMEIKQFNLHRPPQSWCYTEVC